MINYWWKLRVYCNSKFSFVLFSRELSRRLKGSNVVINCSDPGLSATRIHKLHEQLTLSYWWKLRVYCNSKFSFVLFSRELSRRLKGSNVVINCSDPGLSATRIHKLHEQLTLRLITEIYIYFLYVFFKTPREGAQSAIYAAVEDAGT
ncbi:unnamed protein product, partial [Leptidea sinapis]